MAASDSRLLMDARRGAEAAFLELYRRYRTPVFRFAFRQTGSSSAAEDLTQECFLALLAGASFDERRGDLRTYVFGIVRNLAWRRLRMAEREWVAVPVLAALQLWHHAGNHLAAMPAIDAEVGIGRQNHRIGNCFGHAHKASFGEAHRQVCVLVQELQHRLHAAIQVESGN